MLGSFDRVLRGHCRSPFSFKSRAALAEPVFEAWARISAAVNEWNEFPPVDAEQMGRAAGKVEKIEEQISLLESHSASSAFPAQACLALAKDVQVSRLSFPREPRFDPCPVLDDQLRSLYLHPLAHACTFDELGIDPPRVRFRAADKRERLDFLSLLDSSGLLLLHPEGSFDDRACCGAFSIPKSLTADRFIVDARPANLLQAADCRWLSTMGSFSCILQLELSPRELVLSGSDIKEFYHNLKISTQRSALYRFVASYTAAEVQRLSCFSPSLFKSGRVQASLRTLAMGDVNSVSFGQASRVVVAAGERCLFGPATMPPNGHTLGARRLGGGH